MQGEPDHRGDPEQCLALPLAPTAEPARQVARQAKCAPSGRDEDVHSSATGGMKDLLGCDAMVPAADGLVSAGGSP
jgi:hypothetical protein